VTDSNLELPDVETVREWARTIVATRGDAFNNWLYQDGLRIDTTEPMGKHTRVAVENMSGSMRGVMGTTIIVRRIELATYPLMDFAEPFWNHPDRSQTDLAAQGQRNEISLPMPLAAPTLVRVVEWHSYVPELRKTDWEITAYTLYELESNFQKEVAEASAVRAARGLSPEEEMNAWVRGELK